MANTSYSVNAPEAVKLWSRKLFHEALKSTWASRFMGRDSNSVIQIADDTSKGPGDRVRNTLRMLLSGVGIAGDGTLEGNEEALTTYTDDVLIDQLRHAVRSGGKMSEQRIPFSVREEARMGLTDWWADRIDEAFFNHVCGHTINNGADLRYVGHNATTQPDAAHRLFSGNGADDEAVDASTTASAGFSLGLIDQAVETAKLASPQVRPIRVDGADRFVMFLHPRQVRQMRTSTATGQWLDIQKSLVSGTGSDKSPIFSGALGMHNGVIIHESTRVPIGSTGSGTAASGVRRAVLCGAQAATLAFGRGYGASKMSWVEELFDYRNQLGVSAGMIWGIKKNIFNSADFATITVSTAG
jgi:N4-gp56 family major capsid protein